MPGPKITVVGSANMDLVATVDVAPGPGETVTGTGSLLLPGGKGANQAIAAARAGGRVRMVGAVGDDDFGRRIRDLLADAAVVTTDLATVGTVTGTAHVTVERGGENRIVVVPGANAEVALPTGDRRTVVTDADLLLLQLEVPLEVVRAAAELAGGRPTVVLTPAPVQPLPDELLAHVDLLVPNEHEATALTGHADPVEAARALRARGVGTVVVTLGARGCVLVGDDIVRVDGVPVDAVDTTAAGDTFVGCLAVALGEGRAPAHALHWATAAAALSVTTPGASASMPEREAIDLAVAESRPAGAGRDQVDDT